MSNFSTYAVGLITLASVLAGGLLGAILRATVPDNHLHDESKELIKSAAGLMATLVALVIGLLVSSAKGTFDTTSSGIAQIGAKVISLDRVLGRYGSETKPIREQLRKTVETSISRLSPSNDNRTDDEIVMEVAAGVEAVRDKIRGLTPRDEAQRTIQTQALQLSDDELAALLQLLEQSNNDLPTFFVIVLIAWLAVLFASFGILAPPNTTVFTSLIVCAVSISFAVYLILELNRPLQGAVQVSVAPLQKAVGVMGRS